MARLWKTEILSYFRKEINLCNKGPIAGIKQDVDDMVSKAMSFKAKLDSGNEFYRDKIKGLVSSTTHSVVRKSGGLVSGMIAVSYTHLTLPTKRIV